MSLFRVLPAAALLLFVPLAHGEPPEEKKPGAKGGPPALTDLYGDPLPPGALARVGTARLRHLGQVYAVAISPDGKTIASGGNDNTLRLWETATGKELLAVPSPKTGVRCVAFSRDGKLVATGGYQAVQLWDV